MELPVILQAISTVAIVGGLLFAGIQWRAARLQRSHSAEILLLHSFESLEFMTAMREVLALPEGLTAAEVESRFVGHENHLWFWLGMMESIGLLVHQRQIPLRLVDSAFGGPTMLSWHRLSGYVATQRARLKRDSMNEWFEWLADRLAELETTEGRIPAQVREAEWKP